VPRHPQPHHLPVRLRRPAARLWASLPLDGAPQRQPGAPRQTSGARLKRRRLARLHRIISTSIDRAPRGCSHSSHRVPFRAVVEHLHLEVVNASQSFYCSGNACASLRNLRNFSGASLELHRPYHCRFVAARPVHGIDAVKQIFAGFVGGRRWLQPGVNAQTLMGIPQGGVGELERHAARTGG
jgi:hypothetical protein